MFHSSLTHQTQLRIPLVGGKDELNTRLTSLSRVTNGGFVKGRGPTERQEQAATRTKKKDCYTSSAISAPSLYFASPCLSRPPPPFSSTFELWCGRGAVTHLSRNVFHIDGRLLNSGSTFRSKELRSDPARSPQNHLIDTYCILWDCASRVLYIDYNH